MCLLGYVSADAEPVEAREGCGISLELELQLIVSSGSVYWELNSGALEEQSWSHVFNPIFLKTVLIIHSKWCHISILACCHS